MFGFAVQLYSESN